MNQELDKLPRYPKELVWADAQWPVQHDEIEGLTDSFETLQNSRAVDARHTSCVPLISACRPAISSIIASNGTGSPKNISCIAR